MRSLLCLLTCLSLLGGCASQPKDPSGIWINQAAIDAAVDSQHLREALLAYGPNLEWDLNSARQQATFSNGFELADGQLSPQADGLWQVSFYGENHELLKPQGELLIQQASATWPEQRFARPKVKVDAAAPAGSSFEYSLYEAFLAGSWKIRSGPGEGGLVIFHADGKLDGLPGAERFALCLAGDCAAMSGEYDSLWLQLGQEGNEWIFVRDDDQLQIFEALNRAQPDEMPDLYPGPQRWLLERD
ncbi:MAG: hypothetical protein U5M72_07085 [Pseudomonas sp.]|nr:hypothetical protein [Pseudomonas sp.]